MLIYYLLICELICIVYSNIFSSFVLAFRALFAYANEDKIHEVETSLRPAMIYEGQDLAPMTLQNRMQFYKIPAVSIAVINNGEIEWSRAYGVKDNATPTSLRLKKPFFKRLR